MKKKIWDSVRLCLTMILAAVLCCSLAGCNRTIFDTTYSYDYAYIALPNGTVVEGNVENWRDYDGDQLQVTIDGKTYLTHATNVVLVAE